MPSVSMNCHELIITSMRNEHMGDNQTVCLLSYFLLVKPLKRNNCMRGFKKVLIGKILQALEEYSRQVVRTQW